MVFQGFLSFLEGFLLRGSYVFKRPFFKGKREGRRPFLKERKGREAGLFQGKKVGKRLFVQGSRESTAQKAPPRP